MKSALRKTIQWILLIGLLLGVLIQTLGFWNYNPTEVSTKTRIGIVISIVQLIVMVWYGMSYGNKEYTFKEAVKNWLEGVITLIIFYLVFVISLPQFFSAWNLWGIFFPVLTSTSALFSGIIISLFFQPFIFRLQEKLNAKQNVLLLTTITLLIFTLSAGNSLLTSYSIFGLYLVLPFAWGMLISKVKISSKCLLGLTVLSVILLPVIYYATIALMPVQTPQAVLFTQMNMAWNTSMLMSPSSPLLFVIVITGALLFRRWMSEISHQTISILIPAIIFGTTAYGMTLWKEKLQLVLAPVSKKVTILLILALLVASFIINFVFNNFVLSNKYVQRFLNKFIGRNLKDSLNLLQEGINFIKRHLHIICLFAYFMVVTIIGFFTFKSNLNVTLVYIFTNRLGTVVLSSIFLLAIFEIFYVITTRFWVAASIPTILGLGIAIGNGIKMNLREEPIYPTEISEIVNWKTLIPMMGVKNLIYILVGFALLIVVIIFLEKKYPINLKRKKISWIKVIISLLILITPLWFNDENSPIYYISKGFDNNPNFRNPPDSTGANGSILTFLDFIKVPIMDKPANYSESAVKQVVQKYKRESTTINKTRKNKLSDQTIVFNLSESFVNPKEFPTVKISNSVRDPMKYIRKLMTTTTAGHMLSAGYGGGTGNMEYESLTGFNMGTFSTAVTPYTQITSRYNFYPTIGMNFKYSSALHPFNGTFYGRIDNYRRFRFNKFAYLGSKYKIYDQKTIGSNPYLSDETAYQNGIRQIKSQKDGQFINLISMQNHMPYGDYYSSNEYQDNVSGSLIADENTKNSFASYTKGVEYTDKAVKKFIKQIDEIDKPITLVFYGDHYPAIIDQSQLAKYPVKLHATTYFIYSNKYAREHGAKSKIKPDKYISTSSFIPMALDQTNSKVTAYQALLTRIYKELPAITINYSGDDGFELVDQNGKKVSENKLTKKQKELLKDYQLIQYDMSAGKGYSLDIKGFYK